MLVLWAAIAFWVLGWLSWFVTFTEKYNEGEVLFNIIFGLLVWPLLLIVKLIVRCSR